MICRSVGNCGMRRHAGARTFVISWWGQLYVSKIYGPAPCMSLGQIPRTTLIGIPEGSNNGALTWLTYFRPPNESGISYSGYIAYNWLGWYNKIFCKAIVKSKQFTCLNFTKCVPKPFAIECWDGDRKSSPVTGLEWPRRFQEVKVPRLHDNGTGWW
jgi:hypothetical protein